MTRLLRPPFVGIWLLILAAGLASSVFLPSRPKHSLDKVAPISRWARSHLEMGATGDLPPVFFWAWERPEDLRFLKGRDAGVAFLAGTVTLVGNRAEIRPRLQPLLVADDTVLAAVIRIESDRQAPAALSGSQAQQTVDAILELTKSPRNAVIQLDYDTVVSERRFYRQVIEALHTRLAPGKLLSITALASWCLGDPWIRGLPVDEIVPMLFQMGPDRASVQRELEKTGELRLSECSQAIGVSTDESWLPVSTRRRHYVFSPTRWSETQAERVMKEVKSRP